MIRKHPPAPGNPGNGGGFPACDTPNPPWWCDNYQPEPGANIDEYVIYVLFLIAAVALMKILKNNFINTNKKMEITRQEYNKALDVIEAYHKQIFKGVTKSINVNKTPLIEWDKLSQLKERTRNTLETGYYLHLKHDDEILYVEDLTWRVAKRFRNFGTYSWKDFENVRGY